MQATVVYVWLGLGNQTGKEAISTLKKWDVAMPVSKEFVGEFFMAMAQFDYWKRVWIVQEIMLARRIIVCCGSRAVNWAKLASLAERTLANTSPSYAERVIVWKKCWQTKGDRSKAEALHFLLDMFQDMESSDIRDKVYGLCGLLDQMYSERDKGRINIDYSLSRGDIVADVCLSLAGPNAAVSKKVMIGLSERLAETLSLPQDLRKAVIASNEALWDVKRLEVAMTHGSALLEEMLEESKKLQRLKLGHPGRADHLPTRPDSMNIWPSPKYWEIHRESEGTSRSFDVDEGARVT
jgi:hypothetical protein